MKVQRHSHNLIGFLLLLTVPLAGCFGKAGGQADGRKDSKRGGTVVIGSYTKPDVLNPLLTGSTVSIHLFILLFNGLTKVGKDLTAAPDLATSWEVSPDGKTYIFHLRHGVRFHDGIEFTADDVKFTYETASNPKNAPQYYSLNKVERVDAVDSYTVRVVLKRVDPTFLMRSASFPIVPKHLLDNVDLQRTPFNRHPIGTGPFKFEAWADSTRLSLVANDDYFEGRPHLDRVVIRTGPDQSELWVRLMRQEVDVMPFLLPEDVVIVRADSTFKLYSYLDPFYYMLFYNLRDPRFADRRVRLAFSYALDKLAIINTALMGQGIQTSGPFYPNSWAYNPKIKSIPYDPKTALRLLADAGWIDRDGDGKLDKNGKPFQVVFLVDSGDKVKELAALVIRQQFQEVGIKLTLKRISVPKLLNERLPSGAFEMVLLQSNAGDDPATASVFWHSKNIGRYNFSGYKNTQADSLFDLGNLTTDQKRRQIIYQQLHAIIATDQPATFLFFKQRFEAVNRRIAGVAIGTTGVESGHGFNFYQSIKQWYILPQSDRRVAIE